MKSEFAQDVMVVNTEQNNCCLVGDVYKHAVLTPDIDSVLKDIEDMWYSLTFFITSILLRSFLLEELSFDIDKRKKEKKIFFCYCQWQILSYIWLTFDVWTNLPNTVSWATAYFSGDGPNWWFCIDYKEFSEHSLNN